MRSHSTFVAILSVAVLHGQAAAQAPSPTTPVTAPPVAVPPVAVPPGSTLTPPAAPTPSGPSTPAPTTIANPAAPGPTEPGLNPAAPVADGAMATSPEPEPVTEELTEVEWEADPELVDYVAASTKLTEPSQRSPSSVWVVNRAQIDVAGYQSVAEALAEVPGLYVSFDHNNYNVAMRGLYGGARAGSRYLKVMIDGRPVSFAQSGVHYLGPEFIPMAAVDRIEVVRGPVSSLYGAGALVGAINIVTKRPIYEGETAHGFAVGAGGSLAGTKGMSGYAMQTMVSRDTFVMLALGGGYANRSGTSVPKESPFYDKFTTMGTARTADDDISKPLSMIARLEQNLAGGRLTGVALGQFHTAANEFHDLSALTGNNMSRLYSAGASLAYEKPTASGVTILGSLGAWFGGNRGSDAYDVDRPELGTDNTTYTLRRELGYRLIEGSVEGRYDTSGGGWFMVGADTQVDTEALARGVEINRDTGVERERVAPADQTLTNIAAYAQALVPVLPQLRLAANVRWDQHNIYGGAFSARAAVVAPLSPRVSLKLMGGRSYKPASPEQLFGVGLNQLDVSGKETIPPQYLNGVEGLADVFITKAIRFNIGAYFQQYADTLAYLRIGTGLVATPFDADSYGVESTLRARVAVGRGYAIDAAGGVAYSQMETASKLVGGLIEKPVPNNEGVPTLAVTSRVAFYGPRGLGGQLRVRYANQRNPSQSNLLLAGGTPDMSNPSYNLDGYTVVDLSVSSPSLTVAKTAFKGRLGVSNLLDAQWAEIGFNGVDIPSIGRTLWLDVHAQY